MIRFLVATCVIISSCAAAHSASKAALYLRDEQIGIACEGGKGTIDPAAFIERDLTGDGKADLIISHDGIKCSKRPFRSIMCGVQVCSVLLYIREGSLLQLKRDMLGVQVSVGSGNIPIIEMYAHGGKKGSIQWDGSTFQ